MFSATPSDGSNNALHGGIVPGLGFAPSSRGKSFWADPTHPSCVAPGKRPRLTNGPAFAFRDGELLAFGSPGTDVQLQAMLQTLFAVSIFGFDLQQAVELPRFASYSFPGSMAPHACLPGQLNIERGIGETVGGALSALGHKVEWWPDHEWLAGSMCVVRKNTRTGVVEGAADPRRTAYAIGS
jgi:gamma-glutamyltranspeptidase/glutathione hydrolase